MVQQISINITILKYVKNSNQIQHFKNLKWIHYLRYTFNISNTILTNKSLKLPDLLIPIKIVAGFMKSRCDHKIKFTWCRASSSIGKRVILIWNKGMQSTICIAGEPPFSFWLFLDFVFFCTNRPLTAQWGYLAPWSNIFTKDSVFILKRSLGLSLCLWKLKLNIMTTIKILFNWLN